MSRLDDSYRAIEAELKALDKVGKKIASTDAAAPIDTNAGKKGILPFPYSVI